MAKRKVRPQPGALSKLLRDKEMTRMDAHTQTQVDRKTLQKIDRGEEVKLETLQQVATKLRVTDAYFLDSTAAVLADDDDALSVSAPGDIMLRKLSAERLAAILKGASRIRWELNAHVGDNTAREFLEEFEEAVEGFRRELQGGQDTPTDSLRFQLRRLKTAEDIAIRFERLAEYRLAVLGAEYLFWECSSEDGQYEDRHWSRDDYYTSSRAVLLSVEPSGTQSRRVRVSPGSVPPIFAPDRSRSVFVDGWPLRTQEEDNAFRASPYAWALAFAKADIDVAPAFEIADGHCGCLNQNCNRPGKHPLFQEDWTVGTRVKSEIHSWWRRRPTANLIVHTGRRSSLVVIDVDARDGGMEHFGQLSDRFPELANTFRVTTGSRGIHAYLRSDALWRSGMDVLSPGVDLRGEGGYVIGPGSRHISGRKYEANDNSILTMSEELREYLVGIGAAEKADAH